MYICVTIMNFFGSEMMGGWDVCVCVCVCVFSVFVFVCVCVSLKVNASSQPQPFCQTDAYFDLRIPYQCTE